MRQQNRHLLMAAACVMAASAWTGAQVAPPAGQGAGQPAPAGQAPAAARPPAPAQPMSFFVTSRSLGKGGNLGGLAGADAHCQALAAAAGAGDRTWHAYLSTQGPGAVSARDRIGEGPWYSAKGQRIAQNQAELHGDTLDLARLGNSVTRVTAISEKGEPINGVGASPNQHDMLTGSQPDGRAYTDAADHTCHNWTSDGEGTAQLGHNDRAGGTNTSWNSTHPSRGCSQENLVSTGGAGLFYCFAPSASSASPAR